MNEQQVCMDVVAKCYGISLSRGTLLNTSTLADGRTVYQMYRVEQSDGPSLVLFAYHDDFIMSPTFSWGCNQSLEVWLHQRAVLLMYLAKRHYPAPRVLRTHAGTLTTSEQHWHFLVISYIDGEANVHSPEHMFLLGSALGRLHSIQLTDEEPMGPSWWNTYSLAHALERVTGAAASAPSTQKGLCACIQKTCSIIQQELHTFPDVVIHGDCWAPNSIQTGEHALALIDWECAGRGAAILDLGVLLGRCQYDHDGNIPETIETASIALVIAGYTQWCHLTAQEKDLLLEAVRFGILWGGAWIVTRALTEGWTPRIERLLTRIQRGYDLAEPIARYARTCFAP